MIDQPDILVLLRLIAAHLAADFLLQPQSWIEKRKKSNIRAPQLYYHVGIVGILTYVFLWDGAEIFLPLFIMVTHFVIDGWKSTRKESAIAFVTDQTAHLLMILAGWAVYTGTGSEMLQSLLNLIENPAFWAVLIGYIIVIWPFGFLIDRLTQRWQEELRTADAGGLPGLEKAGLWIGRSERFIILTLILLNQYGAIGFLIAAKSVFRFSGSLEGNRDRKEAEYILIGTLLSFIFAIVTGIGVRYFLAG
ncbi:MAG: DUF3307 domain-containing protein [Balneolaceae bacterium]